LTPLQNNTKKGLVDYDADSDEEETEEEEKTNGIIPDSSNDEIKPSEEEAPQAEQAQDQPMENDTTEAPMEKTETEESAEVVTTTKSAEIEATPTVTPSTEEEGDVDEPAAKRPRTEDH